MLKFKSFYALFRNLNVPNNPSMHWSVNVSWTFAEFMHMQVQEVIVKAIQATQFIAVSCDEVTTIDNSSWICIYVHVVQSWVKIPILLQVECIMDGLGNNNLTKVIIVTLIRCKGFIREDVSKKLICFGANGAFVF
jgi:hypothetical protein